jgi:virulence factor Mce-like protein
VLVAALAIVAAVAVAPRLLTPGAHASSGYRVDAIFDTAKGVIAGQLVKIAGARVGTVADVTLTPDYKARIEMDVQPQFAPFRADASCAIRPEGLIAENFVQCDPGTPGSPALVSRGGHAPTVPVSNTGVPVTLNDLFDIWNVPTADRLTLLINDLGAAGAGRGDDINAILRRSNPALSAARSAIAILNQQHAQLAGALHSTDAVIAQLASRPARVQDFLTRAAAVTARTGPRHTQLAQAVARLPPLLAAARPALSELDALTQAGQPLLDNLHAAAPGLNRLVGDVKPFATAAQPTVDALSGDLARAQPAVARLTPIAGPLATFAQDALPTSRLVDQMFVSLRDRGFVEGLLGFLYYGTSSTSRFDATSHFLTGLLTASSCSQFATTPQAGCSAGFGGGGTGAAATRRARGQTRPTPPPPSSRRTSAPGAAKPPGGPSGGPGGSGGPGPRLPHLPSLPPTPTVPAVPLPPLPTTPTVPPAPAPPGSGAPTTLPKILRYLFG